MYNKHYFVYTHTRSCVACFYSPTPASGWLKTQWRNFIKTARLMLLHANGALAWSNVAATKALCKYVCYAFCIFCVCGVWHRAHNGFAVNMRKNY